MSLLNLAFGPELLLWSQHQPEGFPFADRHRIAFNQLFSLYGFGPAGGGIGEGIGTFRLYWVPFLKLIDARIIDRQMKRFPVFLVAEFQVAPQSAFSSVRLR
jgi:hypothetical protein